MTAPTYPEWFLFDWTGCDQEGCDGAVVEFRRNVGGKIVSFKKCQKCGWQEERTVREVSP